MLRLRFFFNISIFLSILVLFYYIFSKMDNNKLKGNRMQPAMKMFRLETRRIEEKVIKLDNDYNLWLIFTKIIDKSPLMYNFNKLFMNLLNVSSVALKFHIIVDDNSKILALREIEKISVVTNVNVNFTFYDVNEFAEAIQDIVDAMTPYFSSKPGTYYSDALFYLSLGLHRVAPKNQNVAIMLDCDVYFKKDILLLFQQFHSEHNLFGLAPELSPVYHHILYNYKQKHNTTFGEYYHNQTISNYSHPKGFQGYNSGVILFNFKALRASEDYKKVTRNESVARMVKKYKFRGHLGDQDFYTLLGFEHPDMIKTLNCGFNRQLCTWWRDNGGYKDIFDQFFKCLHETVVVHGNCNTKIPP